MNTTRWDARRLIGVSPILLPAVFFRSLSANPFGTQNDRRQGRVVRDEVIEGLR